MRANGRIRTGRNIELGVGWVARAFGGPMTSDPTRRSPHERSDMGDPATRMSLRSCGLRITRWLAIAAALSLMEIHDMSTHAISFESDRTGVAPEGWTA